MEPDRRRAAEARSRNLAELRQVVARSEGPRQVVAIANGGDGQIVGRQLERMRREIFRADGATRIWVHEETTRRGQLLGLLDAMRLCRAQGLGARGTTVGIMLPGKGTRLSPLTQRLHGIKPFMPMLVRQSAEADWLSGAGASLFTWTLVAYHLQRMGFSGVAWKWGDEPQIAARSMAALDLDLAAVDAVRFGSEVVVSEDLANNKEWLLRDPLTCELRLQVRRRSRAQLLRRFGVDAGQGEVKALVHIGSPALSHLLLEEAEAVFGELDGWIDVDGYLFEALTHDDQAWQEELATDEGLRQLLQRVPDFRQRVLRLRERVERRRGHPLQARVIDFGERLYWGDIGQLAKARRAFAAVNDEGAEGEFARELAVIDRVERDRFGNRVIGACELPLDGSVRNSVVIDSAIRGPAAIDRSVIIDSELGAARLERAVAFDCAVGDLELQPEAMAFRSIGERIALEADEVHTTLPIDPRDPGLGLEHYCWDSRRDPGKGAAYEQAQGKNARSFAEKFVQMRQREVSPDRIEAEIARRFREPIRRAVRSTATPD